MQIQDGQTILFIGDSITDCGRRTLEGPLGNGYVSMFYERLRKRCPDRDITIINKGIDGDIVLGLQERWYTDVIANRPDWLSVKIGINDLHTTMGWNPDAVTPRRYKEAYEHILTQTHEHLPDCQILLIDPFYICRPDTADGFEKEVLKRLPEYLAIVQELSVQFNTRHVTTHAIFQKLLETHAPSEFCPEPVHPYHSGHQIIANAVYSSLE